MCGQMCRCIGYFIWWINIHNYPISPIQLQCYSHFPFTHFSSHSTVTSSLACSYSCTPDFNPSTFQQTISPSLFHFVWFSTNISCLLLFIISPIVTFWLAWLHRWLRRTFKQTRDITGPKTPIHLYFMYFCSVLRCLLPSLTVNASSSRIILHLYSHYT